MDVSIYAKPKIRLKIVHEEASKMEEGAGDRGQWKVEEGPQ